jgi:hypothetical protein
MSVFMRDGSKSNLSSICHIEDVSDLGFSQNLQGEVNQFTGEKYKQ